MKILVVIGTRPEAIKLAPVVGALTDHPGFTVRVCLTGQHRELLAQGLSDFRIASDYDLDVMTENQSVSDVTARVLTGMAGVLATEKPDWVMVQGDTTTAMATALAAFHHNVPVAHVEAGLRTGDPQCPWPEEMNRRLIGQLASLHFASTEGARANLLGEGVPAGSIHMCGNTVIDALVMACRLLDQAQAAPVAAQSVLERLRPGRPTVLVTLHRRENLVPERLAAVEAALRRIVVDGHAQVVFPFHLNPHVAALAERLDACHPDLLVVPPLNYVPFVALMRRATLILTDSGGIQEEAAFLGKPVLIMRERTERPEVVEGGTGMLVGTDCGAILDAVAGILGSLDLRRRMETRLDAFGDGTAAGRIVASLAGCLELHP